MYIGTITLLLSGIAYYPSRLLYKKHLAKKGIKESNSPLFITFLATLACTFAYQGVLLIPQTGILTQGAINWINETFVFSNPAYGCFFLGIATQTLFDIVPDLEVPYEEKAFMLRLSIISWLIYLLCLGIVSIAYS